MDTHRPGKQLDVVVAGAGVAGLETLIALRSLAGGRVRITVVAPEDEFVYRPQSVGEPFGSRPAQRRALATIASDFDAELVSDSLDSVAPGARRAYLRSGAA